MKLMFQYHEEPLTLEAQPEGDGFRVRLPDGSERHIIARRLDDGQFQITVQEEGFTRTFRIATARTEQSVDVACEGRSFAFTPVSERTERRARKAETGLLSAPMVGVVADVMVAEGQAVEAYQPLVVVEAMKVMATIDAPFAGVVKSVLVEKGQRIAHGAPVVEVVPTGQREGEERAAGEGAGGGGRAA